MITIIVFSSILFPVYIASLATPWYSWAARSYISLLSFKVLLFKWKEATYKLDFGTTITITYKGGLKNTFTVTPALLGVGLFFCIMTLVLASIYQGVGKKYKNRVLFLTRAISLPLQFIFTMTGFFYFYKSFIDNVPKDLELCGPNTEFVTQLKVYSATDRLPSFCEKKFYKNNQQSMDYGTLDSQSSIPAAGYWLCLGILVLTLVQIIIVLRVKYKVDSITDQRKKPTNFWPYGYNHQPQQNIYYGNHEVDENVDNNNDNNNEQDNNNNNVQVQVEMNNLQKPDPVTKRILLKKTQSILFKLMITIIVFSTLLIPIYIASFATPWYNWTSSSYITLISYNVLNFRWNEASYKMDYSRTLRITYTGDLKTTFTVTVALFGIGLFFCLLTLILASIYRGVGSNKIKNRVLFLTRVVSLPLQFIFTMTSFFYFYKSFIDNVSKDLDFCGPDTVFVKQLNTGSTSYRVPSYCEKKFYKVYQPLDFYNTDNQTSAPAAGWWLVLPILVFTLVEIIVVLCVNYKKGGESSKQTKTGPFIYRNHVHNHHNHQRTGLQPKQNFNVYNENEVRDNDPRFYRNEVEVQVEVDNFNVYNNNNNEVEVENDEIEIDEINNNNNVQVQVEMNNLQKSALDPGNI